ncbi:MAG: hypothetical protein ACR2GC_04485 [Methyloceanibacter sp.]|uniref:hypothetical protein n=1 Tax=Methyloceanibacter sp. TaxID=1965321 RepID=UPI003D9B89D1
MQIAWFYRSGIAVAAVTVLLMGTSLQAAESAGASAELDKRTKPAAVPDSQSGGLSDSAVRVLMTYAFSIIPGEVRTPDEQHIKVDKSNPNKFLIPIDDARRVIRVATRSAYAEICQLPELKQSNYQTLMRGEEARKVWTQDQILMIEALHTFSASYFAGGLKLTVTEVEEDPAGPASRATAVSKSDVPAEAPELSGAETEIIAAPTPKCPPEQKQRVTDSINAYVQAAQAAQAPAPKPAE